MERSRVLLLGVFLVYVLMQCAWAQSNVNTTKNANVTVTVSAMTMIDISPATLSYVVNPGQACGLGISGGACNESSGNNYYAIQVSNIGSWNVTRIWFNVSQETQSPFAVGAPTYVDPGNFVALSTNDTTNDFYFVDRKEYKAVRTIVYLRDPEGVMPANLTKYNYGTFHNASQEYYYMIENSSGGCNISGISYIRIGVQPHTTSLIGSTDFSAGASVNYHQFNLTVRSLEGYASYGTGNISVGPLSGYAVAVENQSCAVRFAKWNKDFPFDVGYANYSFSGMLTPGDSLAKKIGIMVPYGIYTTPSAKTGQLTAIAIGAA
jgi:hypothetical protein